METYALKSPYVAEVTEVNSLYIMNVIRLALFAGVLFLDTAPLGPFALAIGQI